MTSASVVAETRSEDMHVPGGVLVVVVLQPDGRGYRRARIKKSLL